MCEVITVVLQLNPSLEAARRRTKRKVTPKTNRNQPTTLIGETHIDRQQRAPGGLETLLLVEYFLEVLAIHHVHLWRHYFIGKLRGVGGDNERVLRTIVKRKLMNSMNSNLQLKSTV